MGDLLEGEALERRRAGAEEKAGEKLALLLREAATNGHDAARIAAYGALLGIMRWYGTLHRGHESVALVCEEYGAEAQRLQTMAEAAAVPSVLQ